MVGGLVDKGNSSEPARRMNGAMGWVVRWGWDQLWYVVHKRLDADYIMPQGDSRV